MVRLLKFLEVTQKVSRQRGHFKYTMSNIQSKKITGNTKEQYKEKSQIIETEINSDNVAIEVTRHRL